MWFLRTHLEPLHLNKTATHLERTFSIVVTHNNLIIFIIFLIFNDIGFSFLNSLSSRGHLQKKKAIKKPWVPILIGHLDIVLCKTKDIASVAIIARNWIQNISYRYISPEGLTRPQSTNIHYNGFRMCVTIRPGAVHHTHHQQRAFVRHRLNSVMCLCMCCG